MENEINFIETVKNLEEHIAKMLTSIDDLKKENATLVNQKEKASNMLKGLIEKIDQGDNHE